VQLRCAGQHLLRERDKQTHLLRCWVGLAEVAIKSWWIASSVKAWRSPTTSCRWVARLRVSQVGHAGGEVVLHGGESGDDLDVLASNV
jgi:hypothetical protein